MNEYFTETSDNLNECKNEKCHLKIQEMYADGAVTALLIYEVLIYLSLSFYLFFVSFLLILYYFMISSFFLLSIKIF